MADLIKFVYGKKNLVPSQLTGTIQTTERTKHLAHFDKKKIMQSARQSQIDGYHKRNLGFKIYDRVVRY